MASSSNPLGSSQCPTTHSPTDLFPSARSAFMRVKGEKKSVSVGTGGSSAPLPVPLLAIPPRSAPIDVPAPRKESI